MNLTKYSTGYFGVPGYNGGMVHVVLDGKPICGTKLHNNAEFQWCAAGVRESYIECQRCLRLIEKIKPTQAAKQAVAKYIKSIRNAAVYSFAYQYAGWKLGGELGDEPQCTGVSWEANRLAKAKIDKLVM